MVSPQSAFWSTHYVRHTRRRQAHLASLGLSLGGKTVLELGAGIGDHTPFFLERQCTVVVTEPQEENLTILRRRYATLDVRPLDLNEPPALPIPVDVVYCYGTLYHLRNPAIALEWMSSCARELLLLETCVSSRRTVEVMPFVDPRGPEQATDGHGCRPTRAWVRQELARHLPYVYLPWTQPLHEEFPLDWSEPSLQSDPLVRAVFVASRRPLAHVVLADEIPDIQVRH